MATASRSLDAGLEPVPQADQLPDELWWRRHRVATFVLWAHVPAVLADGLLTRLGPLRIAVTMLLVAGPALIAQASDLSRRSRAAATTVGLMNATAFVASVATSGVETSAHVFLVLLLLTLYTDWVPYAVGAITLAAQQAAVVVVGPELANILGASGLQDWRALATRGVALSGTAVISLVWWRLRETELARRVAVEEQLRRALSVLTATLEATEDGILVVSNDGRWTHFNSRFLQMWDVSEHAAATRDSTIAIDEVADQLADPESFKARVRELYDDNEAESYDELHFKDGRVFERYSRPQRVDGRPVGRVWSYRDVTTQRAAEVRLRELVTQLETRDEMKSVFLTAVSHELRTPLTSLLGLSSTLVERRDRMNEQMQADILVRINQNAQRLQHLLVDLLDVDRLTRGVLEPSRRRSNIGDLIERVRASLDTGDRVVRLQLEPVSADIDVPMIERVVENLIVNAIRHAPGSDVDVRLWAGDGTAEIAVEDRGPGVRDPHKEAIFEPFMQLGLNPHSPGTGIGLSLVRQLVTLHAGSVWVEDRQGGGASFRISLPLEAATSLLPEAAADVGSDESGGDPRPEAAGRRLA